MKNLSTELKVHLQQEVTTLATCWKVTRRDATVLGFTDHDRDIEFDSVTYLARSGMTPMAVESSASLGVDNLDMEGLLDSSVIEEADLLAGLYDFAEVEMFVVNYADLTQGRMILRTGWMGEVMVKGGTFHAEFRGLSQHLEQSVGELYSPACRANLGDARCGVNVASFTETGTVTAASSNLLFVDSARGEASGYFATGKVTFTSGANAGLSMEVKEFANGQFSLVLPMPYEVMVGDDYSVVAGCDKRFSTCVSVFNNALNFRGEPHVPGVDRVLETASTRSEW